MRLVEVVERTVTLELDPEDCMRLAELLRRAVLYESGDMIDAMQNGFAQVYASLFEALALSACQTSEGAPCWSEVLHPDRRLLGTLWGISSPSQP